MKKITSLILAFSMIISSFVFNISAYASDSKANDSYAQSLKDKGFPQTYINYLVPLHEKYPNWEFVPFNTDLDWQAAIDGERSPHAKQLIQKTSYTTDKYLCNCSNCYKNGNYVAQEGKTWFSASEQAVAYYMDPRASLDEQYIWQFKTTSYSDSESVAGVESIISKTWMANADIEYIDQYGDKRIFYDQNGNTVKYSQAIMTAAKNSNMSAYYLASKILQEVGGITNSAAGASGTYPGYQGIYNYYNIGAYSGAEDGLRWASQGSTSVNKTVANCDCNLRPDPSTKNPSLGKVLEGTEVTILGEVNGSRDNYIWYHVSTTVKGSQVEGYLRSDLVNIKYGKTNTNARMRDMPTTNSGIVVRTTTGTPVQIHRQTPIQSDNHTWFYCTVTVDNNDYTGYIRSDLVDVESDGTVQDKYNRPWTNPYLSIVNGANYIAEGFPKYQNTGYLQKFNVNKESGNLHSHEYMANVRAASQEAYSTYKANLNAGTLSNPNVFYIPVFYNMPCETCNMNTTVSNHDIVIDKGYAPTCTVDGLTDGSHCARCGEIIEAQNPIKAVGHNYTSQIIPPTPNEKGYTLYTCSVCGHSYKDNYTDYDTDKSALISVYNSLKFINKDDYLQSSYDNLIAVANEYEHILTDSVSQTEIDNAITKILNAIYSLNAFVNLDVSSTTGGTFSVNYDTLTNLTDNSYSLVAGTKVNLVATANDGYEFVGWYEQVSKRVLSTSLVYEFDLSANTNLLAKFEKSDVVNLTFTNATGQHIKTISNTANDWSKYSTIEPLLPDVPYSYGNTNGRWVYDDLDVLNKLKSGQDVTIIPQYDKVDVDNPPLPKPNGDIPSIELYNKIDDVNSIGSFIMATGIPEGAKIDSIGLALYFDKAENFDPTDFILTLNNKMLVSKFVELDDTGVYVVNVKKFTSDYTWSARGYITYYDAQGQLQTVYSNQINVVNGEVV